MNSSAAAVGGAGGGSAGGGGASSSSWSQLPPPSYSGPVGAVPHGSLGAGSLAGTMLGVPQASAGGGVPEIPGIRGLHFNNRNFLLDNADAIGKTIKHGTANTYELANAATPVSPNAGDTCILNGTTYYIYERIGGGSYGEVYIAFTLDTRNIFVIKYTTCEGTQTIDGAVKEACISEILNSVDQAFPHIHDIGIKGNTVVTVMDRFLMSGHQYLTTVYKEKRATFEHEVYNIIKNLETVYVRIAMLGETELQASKYFRPYIASSGEKYRLRVIHGDLKTDNIFYKTATEGDNHEFAIADCGLARLIVYRGDAKII
ncbi:MAG: protein kinase family protein, partial [Sphingobacteriia bacterium]|nr:protein kinase family protein [Sphingobacteriia bacterium]